MHLYGSIGNEYYQKILNLVQEKQLESTIVFKGQTNEVSKVLQSARVLLMTSIQECFPMVILEGMSYGVVPISTNVGEISTFINDRNQNGFLIENHTDKQQIVADFLESIQYINKNRNSLEKYSLNAYNSVKQEFSSETNKENYLNLFFN